MTKYESVLAQALELTEEERELLVVNLALSLGSPTHRPVDAAVLAREQHRVRDADEFLEAPDWDDSMSELLRRDAGRRLPGVSRVDFDAFWDGDLKQRLEALIQGEEELIDWDEAESLIFDE